MVEVHIDCLGRSIAFDPEDITPAPINEEKYPEIASLAIDVAGHCNLRCIYCAESSTMPKRPPMKRKTVDQAINALFSWSRLGSGVSIHLGSGEPLLYPEVVRAIGERSRALANEQKRPLSLYLTTNGTRINREIIDWLEKGQWEVKVSIDGELKTHDHNRRYRTGRGTYRKVEEAVKILAERMPCKFSTTSVLCSGTDPSKVFYSIASLGVKSIELVPVAGPEGSALALKKGDLEAYGRFISDYAQRLACGEDLPTNIRFHNRVLRVMGYKNSRVPCGAGRNFFAAGPTGEIFPCFRFIGIQKYKLGDLNGIVAERSGWFARTSGRPYEQRRKCRECWASALCGGPCFSCADLFGSGSPLPEYCEIIRLESKAALWLVDVLREKDPEKLVKLLGVELPGDLS